MSMQLWLLWKLIQQNSTQNQLPFSPKVSSETEWQQETSPFVSLMGQFPGNPTGHWGKRVSNPDVRGLPGQEETAWGRNSFLLFPTPCSPTLPRTDHILVFVYGASHQKTQTIKRAWESMSHFSHLTKIFTYLVNRVTIFNLLSFLYQWAKLASLFLEK